MGTLPDFLPQLWANNESSRQVALSQSECLIHPDENPAMDYRNQAKTIIKNMPVEKSRDFCLMFMNSIKKSRVYTLNFR
jgi:hypothetical protein